MATVWVLGSLNVDAIVRVARHPAPGETVLGGPVELRFGGKGANQAVAAAVAGADVRMIGRVGDDADGRAYRDRLASFGIDVAAVRVDPSAATGRAAIAVDAAGENTIIVSPGANAAVSRADLDALEDLAPADVLLVQLEIDLDVVAEAVRTAAQRGARVVLNAAPFAPLPAAVLALADPVVANEAEAAELAASGAVPVQLLVTRGAGGSAWGEVEVAADRVEEPVDTTGAGDTYCGALAAALAAGVGPADAMRAAAAAAARSVTWLGAQPDPAL
ncbi:MAG TPA: PfkB family carbohydrate kinase [Amnibacterium sp.]|uniref:PfkB family carbohydrate kinase n=1 Tax=Amnibacterium sp. TaxID=1872496 RepID=UPI002F92D498